MDNDQMVFRIYHLRINLSNLNYSIISRAREISIPTANSQTKERNHHTTEKRTLQKSQTKPTVSTTIARKMNNPRRKAQNQLTTHTQPPKWSSHVLKNVGDNALSGLPRFSAASLRAPA
jgi:hypothetical protein